jgi:hypothetical protein
MNKVLTVSIISVCFVVLFSCKDKSTQSTMAFEGITETSATSWTPIGNVDPDDWKPLMDCPASPNIVHLSGFLKRDTVTSTIPTCTKIYPAYPNPANKTFALQFSLSETDSVVLTLNSTPTNVVQELMNRRAASGTYLLYVDASNLQPAIYRVYISVLRQSDILRSYGDVQIVN